VPTYLHTTQYDLLEIANFLLGAGFYRPCASPRMLISIHIVKNNKTIVFKFNFKKLLMNH